MPPADIQRIIGSVARNYSLEEKPEITLEANPDDLTPDYIRKLSGTPVNRLSVGVQSFFDEDLAWLNRAHDSAQVRSALFSLPSSLFSVLSIDLIYGIPGLTDARWISNLETASGLGIPHISAYALTVEEKTALAWMIQKKRIAPPEEEQAARQYRILVKVLEAAGYQHYEISNFCKPGMESRHNSSYWKGVPYLGLGPSAHSFNGELRRWNISSISEYIQGIGSGKPARGEEFLSPGQKYNEYVMTGLRTIWGCDPAVLTNICGEEYSAYFIQKANEYITAGSGSKVTGRMVVEDGVFRLTDEGMLYADGIILNLFR